MDQLYLFSYTEKKKKKAIEEELKELKLPQNTYSSQNMEPD